MALITPLIPATSKPQACMPVEPGTSMHFRFEINLMTNAIVGMRPRVTILRIAWEDKREHVRDYITSYYLRRHVMPSGRHQLGVTPEHQLIVGRVDFDKIRQQIDADLQRKNRVNALVPRLSQIFGRRVGGATAPAIAALVTWTSTHFG